MENYTKNGLMFILLGLIIGMIASVILGLYYFFVPIKDISSFLATIGFAGIGLAFSFYVFIITMIQKGLLKGPELPLFLMLPLIITILSIPTVILLDITIDKRKKYILKWAKKFGIIKHVHINFEEVN